MNSFTRIENEVLHLVHSYPLDKLEAMDGAEKERERKKERETKANKVIEDP